jgi:hypothetical protein
MVLLVVIIFSLVVVRKNECQSKIYYVFGFPLLFFLVLSFIYIPKVMFGGASRLVAEDVFAWRFPVSSVVRLGKNNYRYDYIDDYAEVNIGRLVRAGSQNFSMSILENNKQARIFNKKGVYFNDCPVPNPLDVSLLCLKDNSNHLISPYPANFVLKIVHKPVTHTYLPVYRNEVNSLALFGLVYLVAGLFVIGLVILILW